MTIRRTLLLAFLAVGLLPAVVLTWLAYTQTQAAMRAEIERNLATQAAVTAGQLDKLLFERLQNAVTWNHLEVMQDLHVGDVDKRLSSFLAEMKLRYGDAYTALHAADAQGRIVASSEPAAIGQPLPPAARARRAVLPGGVVLAEAPRIEGGTPVLVLRTGIVSQFTSARLGELVLSVDWRAAQRLLDAGAGARRALVVTDAQGAVIVASQLIRLGPAPATLAADWLRPGAIRERDAAPLLDGRAIVASAVAPGEGPFAGFGWTTLVLEDSRAALAPVRAMAWTFAGLLLAMAAVIVLVALLVSTGIARPIVALTGYVRGFAHRAPQPPPPARQREVGELARVFVQMVDDLEASQETLLRASKLAAVGEFAAIMAHEIRTPLGILRSSAQMLQQEKSLSDEGRELTSFIVSETERLNRLVAAMLDRARARPPQRAPEDVQGLIDRCLAMLQHQAGKQQVAIERDYLARDAIAEVDAEQMMQVLFNLLLNALQAQPQGGLIRVRTQDADAALLIEIIDRGPGIAEPDRARMFEPFVYRREGGLGLGLAVVKQIITAHGGEIAVGAADTGGAVFRIRLPRSATAITAQSSP